jgi:Sporulation and spore germination
VSRRFAFPVAVTLAMVAGCGLPSDSAPRDIPPGFDLDTDSSTTVPREDVTSSGPRAYFVGGTSSTPGTLVGVQRDVQSNDLESILQALFDGPTTAEQSRGLRTAIPEGTQVLDARLLTDGTARLDLNDAIFTATGEAQTDAVAQIVFTATGPASNVKQVELLVDGELRSWRRGDGSLEDQPLTRFMFPALNPTSEPDYPPYPIGAVVTTLPTTTVPP